MRTIYIADDGKEFTDEFDCEHYEWVLNHPHIKDIKCYDKDGNALEDLMEEDTYGDCHKLVVSTDEAVKELSDLANYTGFCEYKDITDTGIWIYEENGINGKFVKVSN